MKIGYISDLAFVEDNMQRFQHIAMNLSLLENKVTYITPSKISSSKKINNNLDVFYGDNFHIKNHILKQKYDFVFIDWPNQIINIPNLYKGKIIYSIIDDHSLLKNELKSNEEKILWDKNHQRLIKESEIVYCTSKPLLNKYKMERYDIKLSQNGVNLSDWDITENNSRVDSYYDNLRKKYKNIIGYCGCVSHWMDTKSITNCAKEMEDTAFVFIGSLWLNTKEVDFMIENYKNIIYLGQKSYYELKYHIKNFDVCTIPFKLNEMTHSVNPIKLYEYMCMKKPIVSSKLNEILNYSNEIFFYDDKISFTDSVKMAIKNKNNNKLKNKLINIAKENTWMSRVKNINNDLLNCDKRFDLDILEDNGEYSIIRSPNKSSNCLITLVDYNFTKNSGNYFKMTDYYFRNYCEKYNLDYIILIGKKDQNFQELMYEKFRIKQFIDSYDRILYVDADVLIKENSENIFEYVPDDKLGMFMESDVTPPWPMKPWIKEYNEILKQNKLELYDISTWDGKYWNAGTIVLSKKHKYIFNEPVRRVYNNCAEQGWINYLISKDNIEMFNIGKKFSGWFSKNVENEDHYDLWFGCNFIHFPGINKSDRILNCINFLSSDISKPKNIIFSNTDDLYDSYDIEIVHSPRKKELSLRNSEGTGQGVKGILELCNFIPTDSTMVEVGCFTGESSEIFARKVKQLYCVDTFSDYKYDDKVSYYGDRSEAEFDRRTNKYNNIVKLKKTSRLACSDFEDNSLDFVYIDANHDYEYISEDLTLWYQKIKPGGYIGGHDYNRKVYNNSVIKSINERFGTIDYLFDDGSWLIKKSDQFIPKISIIIPCYNHSKYINQCIDSILKQSYQNFEIIFIDDCSTDDSLNIISNYNDTRIKILKSETNSGPGYCRNLGIKQCIGEYILPVDADNYLNENCLYEFSKELDKNESDIIYCNIKHFGDRTDLYNVRENYSLDSLMNANYIENCSMYRKFNWYRINGYDECSLIRGYEDWDLWIRMGLKGITAKKINESLFNYRISNSSLCKQADKKRQEIIKYMRTKYDKLQNRNINQPEKRVIIGSVKGVPLWGSRAKLGR